jgi:hypothetical protein
MSTKESEAIVSEKHWTEEVRVGDEVSYRAVSQWFGRRGIVTRIADLSGHVWVKWGNNSFDTLELVANLYAWK